MTSYVLLCEASGELDADEIAQRAGLSSYDVRLRARGTLPAVLASFERPEPALELARVLRERRHGAVAVDGASVEPPIALVRFRLTERAIEGDRGEIAFEDMVALVRVAMHSSVLRVVEERRPGPRDLEVSEQVTRHESASSSALYVFGRAGPPFILREREAKYVTLGARLRPTLRENFLLTVDLLRAAAGRAIYDERFAQHPVDSRRLAIAHGSGSVSAKHDDRLDLLVHGLVRWLTRGSGSLYRDATR